MSAERRHTTKVTIPRKIRPGTRRVVGRGMTLDCLVLASGAGEWAGVDLGSGALVRNVVFQDGADDPLFATAPLDVVRVTIADENDPVDPARPEAIAAELVAVHPKRLRRRALRHLLSRLSAPESPTTPILSARGPSVAYVDLNGRSPSIVVVDASPKTLEVTTNADGNVVAALSWAGMTQIVPVVDPTICAAAQKHAPRSLPPSALKETLGAKVGYVVVGLSAVHDGQAKKVVLAILAR